MILGFAHINDEARIHELLRASGLPTNDLTRSHLQHFMVMRQPDGSIIGVAGIERLGKHIGLLRSLAVHEALRGGGIAGRLYKAVEEHACSMGMRDVFALTTTIADWLTRLGYTTISREEAPSELRQTPEFRGLCPESAVIMRKTLLIPSERLPGTFECVS